MFKHIMIDDSPFHLLAELAECIKKQRLCIINDTFYVSPKSISYMDSNGQDESGYLHPYRVYYIEVVVVGWTNSTMHISISFPDDGLQFAISEFDSSSKEYLLPVKSEDMHKLNYKELLLFANELAALASS